VGGVMGRVWGECGGSVEGVWRECGGVNGKIKKIKSIGLFP